MACTVFGNVTAWLVYFREVKKRVVLKSKSALNGLSSEIVLGSARL